MTELHATDLRLIGVGASPYTRKLRAALRFRRIPYRFVIAGSREANALPRLPLPLMPGLVVPGADGKPDEALSDTTPILDRLEVDFAERPLRPRDPALRWIDALLEDFGDEWLSKCMFHYRWAYAADTKKASEYMPFAQHMTLPTASAGQLQQAIAARQISRIGVVGSNATTAPVIEASWARFLRVFDAHIEQQPYLLGDRPGAGDFACYGQMTMLVITDPTPMAVALEISPRAYAWTERLEDLSGLDPSEADWLDLSAKSPTLHDLLTEVGRVYAPFMIANAEAVTRGADRVECEIDGQPWVQDPFVYQAKCLRWLRERFAALTNAERSRVEAALDGTGCDVLF
jgi:glutathione S-transferase